MGAIKTKALENIERKMQDMDADSLRYHVLENVKKFKTSWIELGQSLYTVLKDKAYREWGYLTFEAYTSKEIGIRKETAMKLLKSYYFLEKEEPDYLKKDYGQTQEVALMPSYESVNLLRLAKNKKEITESDYTSLKRNVFEKGRDVREVKKELTALIRQREEVSPQDARQNRKQAVVRRLLLNLKSAKNEIETGRLVSATTLRAIENLIEKLEAEIS